MKDEMKIYCGNDVKQRQLIKDDTDTIWYGNKTDPYIIAIDIMQGSNGNLQRVFMQLVDSKTRSEVFKQKVFDSLQSALDVGVNWLDQALKRYAEQQETEKIKNSNNRGEKDVAYAIKWFIASNADKHIVSIVGDCESKYRYNCIMLRNETFIDEAQEFDHILVTPSGVVLIETKDWKGTIDITTDGKWIRHKEEDGTPYGVASPIVQMRRHEQLLKSILDNVPVCNILCFSNSSAIINGKENINECLIINIEQLEDVLKKICSNMKYSNHKIDDMVKIIESFKVGKQNNE